jgi:hypothetical protein
MRQTLILGVCCLFLVFSACKKKRAPKPPEAVQLIFPERNSECTEGANLSATTTEVTFQWQAADNTDTYELRVTNNNTRTVQTISTRTTSAKLPIAKGESFSWLVRSKNDEVQQTVSSELWNFYNQGSVTTYAPFPADIIAPRMSENVFKDLNNEVELNWSASDLDNDIEAIDVYFSVETPPNNLVQTLSASATSLKVSVTSNTVYYWSVVVRDASGNATNSGIFSFKAL